MTALFGIKVGMTRIFDDAGNMIPVTLIKTEPHLVIQIKTRADDGYNALRLGFGQIRKKLVSKPLEGQLKKAGVEPCRYIREVRVSDPGEYKVGSKIDVGVFSPGDKVHVVGISKGYGFQGVVRRYGFKGGPKTHGQSDRLRAPGSIGASSFPSRVWRGQRMAGHMGNKRVTVKNLLINSVEPEHNLILIRGAVPGKPGGLVKIVKV
jgi:large subunit ribosomal protein L3